jgi:hypothetical protein
MISYGSVNLQFVDNQVLARAPSGIYEKATSVNVDSLPRKPACLRPPTLP